MKRGSFFARMYGKAGGKLPPLRKRYYNQMTVGADSIRPQHKAPLRGACVPGRHARQPLQLARTITKPPCAKTLHTGAKI